MLRDWFHMIDFDHSGQLSMTEFFGFSLREALARSMQTDGLVAFLQIWDMNSDNKLDAEEFSRVTSALGFASITKDLMELHLRGRRRWKRTYHADHQGPAS